MAGVTRPIVSRAPLERWPGVWHDRGVEVFVRLLIILAGCLLIGLAVAQRDERPQARHLWAAPSAAPSDSVRIEHRLLTVEPAPLPPARVLRAAQKERSVTRTATRPRPFFAKARQLVLGDGRFRPQPFPQPASR
jgi:hypothetical protein